MGSLDEFRATTRLFLRGYPWRRIDPVPWTPLPRPLAECRLALVTSAALVRPDKKLAGLEAKSVVKKFKEKGFAAAVDREKIARCSEIGLELDAFIGLGLKAMQGIAEDLGL